jgi:hypothetical protein
MEACLRREEWSEDDRLSAVKTWLSDVNEGTDRDVIVLKDYGLFFIRFSFSLENFFCKTQSKERIYMSSKNIVIQAPYRQI